MATSTDSFPDPNEGFTTTKYISLIKAAQAKFLLK